MNAIPRELLAKQLGISRLRCQKAPVILLEILLASALTASGQMTTPWVPYYATISNWTTLGVCYAKVTVALSDSCKSVGSWGTPQRGGSVITVDSTFFNRSGVCLPVILNTANTYNLGVLAPGSYSFNFRAWGTTVVAQQFTVPNTDSDSDGMSDWLEWKAGTNPADSNSCLKVLGLLVSTAGFNLIWQGGTSVQQYVQCSTNLQTWTDIHTNHPPTPVVSVLSNLPAANGRNFYRVRVE